MPDGLRSWLSKHREQVDSTIKMMDIEERFDLYFSRFFGLFFAQAGKRLSMTPTQVSVISLLTGMLGGVLLYYQDSWKIILGASFLITLSGVLDSADGQLARMTGQSTDLGRIIDGLVDNFVFVACYLGGAIYFVQFYGWPVIVIAALAGVSHSFKSAIYEFYKSEYLFFAGPFKNSNIGYPETIEEKIKVEDSWWRKLILYSYLDYTKRQYWLSTRTRAQRSIFQNLAYNPDTKEEFTKKYRDLNKPIMFWWALICGTNTHRSLIMILSLFSRFDVYLVITIVTIVPMLIVSQQQKKLDKMLSDYFD